MFFMYSTKNTHLTAEMLGKDQQEFCFVVILFSVLILCTQIRVVDFMLETAESVGVAR